MDGCRSFDGLKRPTRTAKKIIEYHYRVITKDSSQPCVLEGRLEPGGAHENAVLTIYREPLQALVKHDERIAPCDNGCSVRELAGAFAVTAHPRSECASGFIEPELRGHENGNAAVSR